ncbi:hypothetical protein [Methanococcoides sp. AM1]|uniref:hypothetical protein n=1 Tax=Methanococcoides sp. AM1 TaxID=1201011 RepID=UPI001083DBBB|nr:hypothetical protein [Methanococcoides sp. AM1]
MYIPVTTCDDLPVYADVKMQIVMDGDNITDILSYQVDDFVIEDELVNDIKRVLAGVKIASYEDLEVLLKDRFGIFPGSCPGLIHRVSCAVKVNA